MRSVIAEWLYLVRQCWYDIISIELLLSGKCTCTLDMGEFQSSKQPKTTFKGYTVRQLHILGEHMRHVALTISIAVICWAVNETRIFPWCLFKREINIAINVPWGPYHKRFSRRKIRSLWTFCSTLIHFAAIGSLWNVAHDDNCLVVACDIFVAIWYPKMELL